MNHPNSWDDDAILKYEPLQSHFCKWRKWTSSRGLVQSEAPKVSLIREIRVSQVLMGVVWFWLELALEPLPSDKTRPDIAVNLFVDFYWNLSQKRDTACAYLKRERHVRGLVDLPGRGAVAKVPTAKPLANIHFNKTKKVPPPESADNRPETSLVNLITVKECSFMSEDIPSNGGDTLDVGIGNAPRKSRKGNSHYLEGLNSPSEGHPHYSAAPTTSRKRASPFPAIDKPKKKPHTTLNPKSVTVPNGIASIAPTRVSSNFDITSKPKNRGAKSRRGQASPINMVKKTSITAIVKEETIESAPPSKGSRGRPRTITNPKAAHLTVESLKMPLSTSQGGQPRTKLKGKGPGVPAGPTAAAVISTSSTSTARRTWDLEANWKRPRPSTPKTEEIVNKKQDATIMISRPSTSRAADFVGVRPADGGKPTKRRKVNKRPSPKATAGQQKYVRVKKEACEAIGSLKSSQIVGSPKDLQRIEPAVLIRAEDINMMPENIAANLEQKSPSVLLAAQSFLDVTPAPLRQTESDLHNWGKDANAIVLPPDATEIHEPDIAFCLPSFAVGQMEGAGRAVKSDIAPVKQELYHPRAPALQLVHDPESFVDVSFPGPQAESKPHDRMKITATMFSLPDARPIPEGVAAIFPKPILPRLPPIWAESRQEVCEAFDWFRSYQGGVYHAHEVAKGYLLSAFASSRDIFEHGGKLIISHGGGKAESLHCRNGIIESHQASDQLAEDKSVRALLNNYRNRRPLALLMDDKYALFPYHLGSRGVIYAVLGFYTIAYAWAEYQYSNNDTGRVIRYKFAFQWCEEQGTPWWHQDSLSSKANLSLPSSRLPANADYPVLRQAPKKFEEVDFHAEISESSTTCISEECEHCRSVSPKVYSVWACLKPDCEMFWKHNLREELLPNELEYNKEFLKLSTSGGLSASSVVFPPPPITSATNGIITGYAFTRGLHCPKCGRLSCKFQWEKLECLNCGWNKNMETTIRNARELWCDRLPLSFKHYSMSIVSDIVPLAPISFLYGNGRTRGVIQTFDLPYKRGKIHHIRSLNTLGMSEADEIFIKYQEQANAGKLKFRRWPMRAHKCRGALLTNYFSHNAGEPYQYVGGDANTVPFDQAPAVVEARTLIQKRIHEALGISAEFNEVLSAAYMERQRMAFHSDSEVGLGPLVAGLSLGSPALIHFRLQAKHDPMEERRGVLLSIVLRHGDILVMNGNGVQDCYEHTVVPNNFRIAATARQITPKHHMSTKRELS